LAHVKTLGSVSEVVMAPQVRPEEETPVAKVLLAQVAVIPEKLSWFHPTWLQESAPESAIWVAYWLAPQALGVMSSW
jgi:hypothetical protein